MPGALSYSLVILLFLLSWINPILGAIYVLIVVAITFVKAIATAFRTIQGHKVVQRAERVDWRQRFEDLRDPHAAFERLHGRHEDSYGFQEHVQNLRILSVVEGKNEPKPDDIYHAVIMVAYDEGWKLWYRQ